MKKALILACLIPFALGPSLPVAGQDTNIGDFKVANPLPVLEYAVKFVCGKPENPVVAPGVYYTAINVHNPNSRAVKFAKKIAIALPDETAGEVTDFVQPLPVLKADYAMEIDCPNILKHARKSGFLKGFVVIRTNYELDVVAVYTAAGSTGSVETLFVERVPPRRL